MWDVVPKITSAFALVAFLVAAACWAYRKWLVKNTKLIKTAPKEDRADLIARDLDVVQVDTNNLTREQKYDIALVKIREKAARSRMASWIAVIVAILLTIVSIVALTVPGNDTPAPLPVPTEKGLKVNYSEEIEFDDGTNGLKVPVRISRTFFPQGVPEKMNLFIELTPKLNETWFIAKLIVAVDDDIRIPLGEDQYAVNRPLNTESHQFSAEIELKKLLPASSYVVDVYLHERSTLADISNASAVIEKGDGVRAVASFSSANG